MPVLQLQLFVAAWSGREQALADRWEALAADLHCACSAEIHDVGRTPELARQYDIILTPTALVTLPDGQTFRCIGYTEDLHALLKSRGFDPRLQMASARAGSLLDAAMRMREDARRMQLEAGRMQEEAGRMQQKASRLRGKIKRPTPRR